MTEGDKNAEILWEEIFLDQGGVVGSTIEEPEKMERLYWNDYWHVL